jgi:hypothetical protein
MNEKAVPHRIIEPGSVISQGRGGQAIIQDIVGNILLTTQNTTGSNQQILSINDSISSILIQNGETSSAIQTSLKFPSNNFNTINYEQTPIGGIQVIQPIYNITTSSLNSVTDVLPTSSISQSVIQQEESQITPIDEQLLFLPDNENQFSTLTDEGIEGTELEEFKYLTQGLETIITTVNGKVQTSSGCKTAYKEFEFTSAVNPTLLTYSEAKTYLKSKYPENISRAVFAIIWAESSKSGTAFKSAGGYNYAGVQTDNARWTSPGVIGQFCTRDSRSLRAFAIFKDDNSFLDFMAARVKKSNINGDNAEKFAADYLNKWVYNNLEKQNPTLFRSTLPLKAEIYRSALRRFES